MTSLLDTYGLYANLVNVPSLRFIFLPTLLLLTLLKFWLIFTIYKNGMALSHKNHTDLATEVVSYNSLALARNCHLLSGYSIFGGSWENGELLVVEGAIREL
jgi:hypothetical protein